MGIILQTGFCTALTYSVLLSFESTVKGEVGLGLLGAEESCTWENIKDCYFGRYTELYLVYLQQSYTFGKLFASFVWACQEHASCW